MAIPTSTAGALSAAAGVTRSSAAGNARPSPRPPSTARSVQARSRRRLTPRQSRPFWTTHTARTRPSCSAAGSWRWCSPRPAARTAPPRKLPSRSVTFAACHTGSCPKGPRRALRAATSVRRACGCSAAPLMAASLPVALRGGEAAPRPPPSPPPPQPPPAPEEQRTAGPPWTSGAACSGCCGRMPCAPRWQRRSRAYCRCWPRGAPHTPGEGMRRSGREKAPGRRRKRRGCLPRRSTHCQRRRARRCGRVLSTPPWRAPTTPALPTQRRASCTARRACDSSRCATSRRKRRSRSRTLMRMRRGAAGSAARLCATTASSATAAFACVRRREGSDGAALSVTLAG
mmetsp:Transcript_19552/g.64658  ORF Transcript_19552/g.64658 Transcript_19552/m.64658 type:complete len:344 (+) Transcript_19552:265-1296(+)